MKKLFLICCLFFSTAALADNTNPLTIVNNTEFPIAIYENGQQIIAAGAGMDITAQTSQIAAKCNTIPICNISIVLLKASNYQVATAKTNTDNNNLITVSSTADAYYYINWANNPDGSYIQIRPQEIK